MVDVSLGAPRASRRSSLFLETSVGDLALLLFLNLALFGEAIQSAMGFSYCDEIATIAVVCAAFFRFHASKNALADGMYKEASYKPYAIAAMMFLQKVADPAATLKALEERATARWYQA